MLRSGSVYYFISYLGGFMKNKNKRRLTIHERICHGTSTQRTRTWTSPPCDILHSASSRRWSCRRRARVVNRRSRARRGPREASSTTSCPLIWCITGRTTSTLSPCRVTFIYENRSPRKRKTKKKKKKQNQECGTHTRARGLEEIVKSCLTRTITRVSR